MESDRIVKERRANRWLAWAGAALGIAGLAWVLRGFDLQRFLATIAGADLRFVLLVPVVVLVEQLVRAWKWRQLLWPLRAVGTASLFGAIMAGYLLAVLIPFGFGTIARSWLVARRERLRLAAVLATVALDRLSDGVVFVALVPLALLGTAFPDPTGGVRAGLAWGGLSSFVLFAASIAALDLFRRQAARPGPLVGRIARRLPARAARPLARLAASFVEGVNWPGQPWRGAGIVAASVAIKLFATLQMAVAGLAFGVTLRPAEYLFVMVFLGFLAILGHFLRLAGGFVIGAVFALRLLGVPEEEALAMALVVQAANLLAVAGVGALALWSQGVALSEARRAARQADLAP